MRSPHPAEGMYGSLRHLVKPILEKISVATRTGTASLKPTNSSLVPTSLKTWYPRSLLLTHAGNSSTHQAWETPAALLEALASVFKRFDLDPCAARRSRSRVRARVHFTHEDDGLTLPWHGVVFVNAVRADAWSLGGQGPQGGGGGPRADGGRVIACPAGHGLLA